MGKTGFRIVILLAVIGVSIFAIQARIENQADRFMERVNLEVLEKFDENLGPSFMVDPILEIARQENIILTREDVQAGFTSVDNISSASALEAMTMDSIGEVVAVKLTFDVKRFLMTERFVRVIDKPLADRTVSGATNESSGFSMGVDVPAPSRSIQSYRESVNKAVGEREGY